MAEKYELDRWAAVVCNGFTAVRRQRKPTICLLKICERRTAYMQVANFIYLVTILVAQKKYPANATFAIINGTLLHSLF